MELAERSWLPNLVDEAEDLTEVTAHATGNSCQSLLEDVDPAASLVQLLGMERTEALSLCAFFAAFQYRSLACWCCVC